VGCERWCVGKAGGQNFHCFAYFSDVHSRHEEWGNYLSSHRKDKFQKLQRELYKKIKITSDEKDKNT